MLTLVLICTLVAAANAGYASSSSGGAGLYSDNSYSNTYGSNYPYSNSYTGYANAGGIYAAPVGPYQSPIDFQNQFLQYYNSIAQFNQNLYNQQLLHQAQINNAIQSNIASIQHAALGGASYGNNYGYQPAGGVPNRFGGSSSFASGGAYAGNNGGSVGSYGGVRPTGNVYGGTTGGRPQYSPNYASSGGHVSSNGNHQQHAAIYPANPARPNLDSRFGDDGVGVSHTSTGHAPGFVGVSSFSSSSDINGMKHRESGTSVNKNGQVTTYYTRN